MFVPPGLSITNYQARTAMRPHSHDAASLSIVVRGTFVECIGGRERRYARGQIAYLPAGMVHSQRFGVAGVRQVILAPRPSWLEYLATCRTRMEDSPHTNALRFGELADRLLLEMNRDDGFSALACDSIMLEIVAAFGRICTRESPAARPPPWLCAVHDFARENALAPPSMQAIARIAGRHEIHVAREFRRFFGASLGSYMRRLRVEHAMRLLRTSDTSLIDIALECGFGSHSHLCRAFKTIVGVTPANYRRSCAGHSAG